MVGIHTGPNTHLDHLGVLCALLDIPLWVTEEKAFNCAKTYYPQLNVVYKEHLELSLEYLAQNCDVILESGHTWAVELSPLLTRFFQKKMRVIYCPHGNSDKEYGCPKDISFVYGEHMIDLMSKTGSLDQLSSYIITGNYRYSFYCKHKEFYDSFIPKMDNKKKILLYAPTWPDKETPSFFFERCHKLIEEISPHFNLLVKFHPFLEEDYPAEIYCLYQHPTTLFLTDFPPIYPLLNASDGYIGDFSSIGYDFLIFDRPMFFSHEGPLSSCGVVIPNDVNYGTYILDHWNQKDLSKERKKRHLYAFGGERSVDEIKEKMREALSKFA